MRPTGLTLAASAAAVGLASCTGNGSSASGPTATATASSSVTSSVTSSAHPATTATRPPSGSWPTYHGSNDRAGFADVAALKAPLRRAWAKTLDGAVYAQPLVVGATIIAATENNTVYALRSGSGQTLWRRHLGSPVPGSALPCGNIDPLGITGTPAYDATTGNVFAVTETTGGHHTLQALDAQTGRPRWHRSLDVVPGRDLSAEQQRSALLVANGRVYVAFGGLYGDCGNYIGYVAAVRTDGKGRTLHYTVPTARQAGMWSAAGPVAAPRGGDIYVASGNGAETGGNYDGSDSVIRLSPTLHRRALFAPSTWASDNAQDLDLGSASPVLVAGRVVIAGKRGTVYLLPPALGGVGGQRQTLDGCAAYGGAAVAGTAVILPCADGIRRLDVRAGSMHWRWRLSGVGGSPAVARTAVYSLDQSRGDLLLVALATGEVKGRVHVGAVSRFATPVPTGGAVYVGTTHGVVAVRGSG
jgi:outer membrane protein assembly factor BamB